MSVQPEFTTQVLYLNGQEEPQQHDYNVLQVSRIVSFTTFITVRDYDRVNIIFFRTFLLQNINGKKAFLYC